MVTVIDLEKRASIGQVSVGIEPEGLAVSPDSKILICTSETTSMVHFIDTRPARSWPTCSSVLARVFRRSSPTDLNYG